MQRRAAFGLLRVKNTLGPGLSERKCVVTVERVPQFLLFSILKDCYVHPCPDARKVTMGKQAVIGARRQVQQPL